MKSYLRILIVAGVVILVAVGAWYALGNKKTDDVAVSPTPETSIAPLASVSPLVISYASAGSDWKTYASASAGFKISYPADWTPTPCGPACVGWTPANAQPGQFALGIIQSESTLEEILTSAQPYLVAREDIKAGSNAWVKLTLQQPTSGDIVTSHFIAQGEKLFEVGTATTDTKILEVYGKMIRSFTLTK